MTRPATLATLALALPTLALAADRKNQREKEPETQILELPKDPPAYVTAEASRLVFHTAPLQSRGLLSQQVKTALKALFDANKGANIVKMRAFVAGTGDMRRVQAIVSEVFTDKKLPLPALTVLQVGGLPQNGAQVALESIAVNRKAVNPNGLAFLASQGAEVEQPFQPVLPLFEKTMARLQTALGGSELLAATCYVSSLDQINAIRERAYRVNPRAAWTFLQPTREPYDTRAECEAVARSASGQTGPGPVTLTGMQLAFGRTEADARLAFERLAKTLETAGASWKGVALLRAYALTRPASEQARRTESQFTERAPAGAAIRVEGLPSMDASFALEAIALPQSRP